MGSVPQNTETVNATLTSFNHYPPTRPIQLKLYQAFIFSIPVLFSVILILLFYLFYLKTRSTNLPSSTPRDPPSSTHASPFESFDEVGFKEMQIRLVKVILDEDQREKDPLCSVCLGEYEMKEELVQLRVCKHLFHIECINHWLQSNATCPLCRSSVFSSSSSSNFLSKSTPQPSNSLVDEASSSSSSPSSSASSVIIVRNYNDDQLELPVALNIIVQN